MNEVIKVNVGGTYFTTTRATLRADAGSMLARKFDADNGFADPVSDSEGCPFLDLTPSHFEWVLDYLRCGCKVPQNLPNGLGVLYAIKRDADYLGLEGLVAICDVNIQRQRLLQKNEVDNKNDEEKEELKRKVHDLESQLRDSKKISSFRTVTKVWQEDTDRHADKVDEFEVFSAEESREWQRQGYEVKEIHSCVANGTCRDIHCHYTTILLEKKS